MSLPQPRVRTLPTMKSIKGESQTKRVRPGDSGKGPARVFTDVDSAVAAMGSSDAPVAKSKHRVGGESEAAHKHAMNFRTGMWIRGKGGKSESISLLYTNKKPDGVVDVVMPTHCDVFGVNNLPITIGLLAGYLYGHMVVAGGVIVTDDSPIEVEEVSYIPVYQEHDDVSPHSPVMMFKMAWGLYTYAIDSLSKADRDLVVAFLVQVVNNTPNDDVFITDDLRDRLNNTAYVNERYNDTIVFYRLVNALLDLYGPNVDIMVSGMVNHKIDTASRYIEGNDSIHIRNNTIAAVLFSTVVLHDGCVYVCDTKRGNGWYRTEYDGIGGYVSANPNTVQNMIKYLYLREPTIKSILAVVAETTADDTIATARIGPLLKAKYPPFVLRDNVVPCMNGILIVDKARHSVQTRRTRRADMVLNCDRAPFYIQSHRLDGVSVPMVARQCTMIIDGVERIVTGDELVDQWLDQMFPLYNENIEYPSDEAEQIARDGEYRRATFHLNTIHSLDGESSPKKFLILYGPNGNEGKSGITTAMTSMVPPSCAHEAGSQVFTTTLRTGATSSNQHSDPVRQCCSRRMLVVSEIPAEKKTEFNTRYLDPQYVKPFTSGGVDWINARGVREKTVKFKHKGICMAVCNDPPGMMQNSDKAMLQRPMIQPMYSRFEGSSRPDDVNWIYPQMEMTEEVTILLASMLIERALQFLEQNTQYTLQQMRYYQIRPVQRITGYTGTRETPEWKYVQDFLPSWCVWNETMLYLKTKMLWVSIIVTVVKEQYVELLNDPDVPNIKLAVKGKSLQRDQDPYESDGEEVVAVKHRPATVYGMLPEHSFVACVDFTSTETIAMLRRITTMRFGEVQPLISIVKMFVQYITVGGMWYRYTKRRDTNMIEFAAEGTHPWFSEF